MWKLLEQAAKSASVNASGYVNSVQEKAQSLAAAVQDEASTLLNSAMGSARSGPVDEILYEELADYKEFCAFFSAEEHTHEITRAVDEDETIRELHDLLVPLELSYDEFWCRYFFRQQQGEKHEKERKTLLLEHKQAPEDEDEEEEDEALAGDDEHKSVESKIQPPLSPSAGLRHEKAGSDDHEGVWLLRAARDAERRAANQWRQKARDLHHQLQEIKQLQDENEQKAMKEWEEQLQALCDTYETKMAAATMQIDEARATGYDEGVRESQAIVESVRQAAEEDMNRLRTEITEGGQASGSVDERVDALVKEKDELQQALQVSRDRLAELEKCTTAPGEKAGDAALAELAKEKDLWRMRALKMKKLKDLVQAELTSLRQQRNAGTTAASENITAGTDDHSKLQSRMNELQAQLANAVAGAEARAREAYEKGVTAGKADAEQRAKQEREQAFSEGYKKAQAEAKSEVGVLKAELGMFRAFHESAAYAAEMVEDSSGLLNDSLDDISLADGAPLCSPTSSISIFTDNGKNDFATTEVSKSTDDWGEW